MDDRDQILDLTVGEAPPEATAVAEPEPQKQLADIVTMDDYLRQFGKTLARKAITSLDPLQVQDRDGVPDFDDMLREPFPCQANAIAAASKMLDEAGSGFLVGEMGTGKVAHGSCSPSTTTPRASLIGP